MEASTNRALQRSLHLLFKVLSVFGCWPSNEPTLKWPRLKYKLFSGTLLTFSLFLPVTTEIIYIIKANGNLEKMLDAMFLPMGCVSETIKIWTFFFRRPRIMALIKVLDDRVFQPRDRRQLNLLSKRLDAVRTTYIVFVSMAIGAISLGAISPLYETEERGLPVDAWYPFDTTKSPLYEIAYAHQIIAVVINATIGATTDCAIAGFMAFIAAQLEILNESFAKIQQQAVQIKLSVFERNNERRNHPLINLGRNFDEEINRAQRSCMKHHLYILRFSDEVNELFSISMFVQVVMSTVTICVTNYRLTAVTPLSVSFFAMILFQGCMVVELFLFCWYGNEIMLQSTKLSTSVYNSDWTDFSQLNKRTMLFIMMKSQKPIAMYAGNFFVLSLETFTLILQRSWSFLAVLLQLVKE